MITLAPLWFGFWRRFYGAKKTWFPAWENNTAGYALPLAMATFLIFPLVASAYWQAAYFIGLAVAWWGGIQLTDYSDYWGMTDWADAKGMMIEGIFCTAPVGLILAIVAGVSGSWINAACAAACALSGALIAPGYWLGWRTPKAASFLNTGTEWGEVISWALIGLIFEAGGQLWTIQH